MVKSNTLVFTVREAVGYFNLSIDASYAESFLSPGTK
jgi:hypothetical protein